jgi:hypothetical protein
VAQDVTIDGVVRHFATGERIHTENSYKYAPDDFDALLARRRASRDDALARRRAGVLGVPRRVTRRYARVAARRTPENCQRASGAKKLR